MSWPSATARGLLIFLYFFFATVWLPDFVLTLSSVAGASSFIRDLIALVVWGTGLGVGMWMLRVAQSRDLI